MAYSTTGLPVIPYTLTTEIDGIKYETHVLTNTCQVITEDGVTLCDVLKGLVTSKELEEALKDVKIDGKVFKFKGVLNNLPDKTAIQQLYEKVGAQTGDVYLVQISYANCDAGTHVPNLAYDMYCWIRRINTWVWIGSTQRQPDLNWENPKVKEEIYKMINWWLDKGLAGFRIDAIINIKKDLSFQDFEADGEDGLCDISKMLNKAQGIGDMLKELKRETFDKYDAFTVGEVFNAKEGELGKFIGEDGYFSSIFDFDMEVLGQEQSNRWYLNKEFTTNELREVIFKSQLEALGIGFKANIIENHDEPRGVSRYIKAGECNDTSKKALAIIEVMRRGIICYISTTRYV